MGRPRGSKNKDSMKKAVAEIQAPVTDDPFADMTDGQVLEEVHTRFSVMDRMVDGCIEGKLRGMIISGAAGIGKTYTVEQKLANKKDEDDRFRSRIIKGAITPVNLFKVLQDYPNRKDVVLIDDADNIYFDDAGVAILKAALDSSPARWISWLAESNALRDSHKEYDKEFMYNGTMIFITNTDFQGIVDAGKGKLVPHFEALMSRTIYMDLKVHHRRAISIWVNFMVRKTNMLMNHYDLTKEEQNTALHWILENRENMRTLSLRDAMKIGMMMKTDPDDWEEIASVTLLRSRLRG